MDSEQGVRSKSTRRSIDARTWTVLYRRPNLPSAFQGHFELVCVSKLLGMSNGRSYVCSSCQMGSILPGHREK